MYNISRNILFASAIFASAIASANNSENFNSRKGVSLKDVRANLQNACWTFHHFDVNINGWNPSIEGDGAMVSNSSALNSGNAGIYTPILDIKAPLNVRFHYRFNSDFAAGDVRWIKLCLANANNQVVQVLDQFELNGVNATAIHKYSTTFENTSQGEFRLVIFYGGSGGAAAIAIDELTTSAPLYYKDGCHLAPLPQLLQLNGEHDRSAQGQLLPSDSHQQKAFLVRNAENGKVELFPDGTFVFIPDTGFKGKNTSFIYRVCNDNGNNLCSEPVTVKINFPSNRLISFDGSYKSNGKVELAWNTEKGNNIRRFEIERSTDGHSWAKSAVIPANDPATNVNVYTYTDHVGKNTALKKDLYYRIRHTDSEGVSNTSKPMIVRIYNKSSLTMICVAPNPTKREIAVNVQLQETSMVTMRIYDRSQNTLIHRTVQAEAGVNNIVVEGSRELAPGNYLLEVIVNSKERMLVKLIKE